MNSEESGGMEIVLPERVKLLFIAAGWYSRRRMAVSPLVPMDHPANAILAAFGGLIIMPSDSEGEECACNDLAFHDLFPDMAALPRPSTPAEQPSPPPKAWWKLWK
jgi:hypothetical protein